jgi:homoserine kinase
MLTAKVFAPGTIANVGPGFDCLGLCLEGLGDEITVGPSSCGRDQVIVAGRDAASVPVDPDKNCAMLAAASVRRFAKRQDFICVRIERALPLSGGLGASAASSVGGALAACYAFGLQPTFRQVLEWALQAEEAVAGRHLDNIAPCLLGGLSVAFFCDQGGGDSGFVASSTDLSFSEGSLVMALVTPNLRIETRAARSLLPESVARQVYVTGLSHVAAVTMALMTGDAQLLARGLDDPFAVPARKSLIPGFDTARQVALDAGALGLGISGSGPTLFAPCLGAPVAAKVAQKVADVFGGIGASVHISTVSAARRSGLGASIPPAHAAQAGGARCLSLVSGAKQVHEGEQP